ncbi:MAG: hypothetical protein ABT01_02885 [Clostridium sp. SCN 57-10]|nr:MAG: hypothetical protein ABT01_02885 [Clostridium sp. SCN 57-10]
MIRTAGVNDVDGIVELRIKLLHEINTNAGQYDWAAYARALKDFLCMGLSQGTAIAYLAEEQESIVAFTLMCFGRCIPLLSDFDGKTALLTDMYTAPPYRRRGVGTALLSRTMEQAKSLGYKKVILHATESGRALYQNYGFRDVSGEMAYKFQ